MCMNEKDLTGKSSSTTDGVYREALVWDISYFFMESKVAQLKKNILLAVGQGLDGKSSSRQIIVKV